MIEQRITFEAATRERQPESIESIAYPAVLRGPTEIAIIECMGLSRDPRSCLISE